MKNQDLLLNISDPRRKESVVITQVWSRSKMSYWAINSKCDSAGALQVMA